MKKLVETKKNTTKRTQKSARSRHLFALEFQIQKSRDAIITETKYWWFYFGDSECACARFYYQWFDLKHWILLKFSKTLSSLNLTKRPTRRPSLPSRGQPQTRNVSGLTRRTSINGICFPPNVPTTKLLLNEGQSQLYVLMPRRNAQSATT